MTEHSRCQPGGRVPRGLLVGLPGLGRLPQREVAPSRLSARSSESSAWRIWSSSWPDRVPILKVGAHVEIHIPVGRVGVIALDQPAHRHDHLRDVPGGARLDVWRAAANRVVGPGERALVALGDDPGGDALGLGCAQDLDLDKAQFGTQRSAQLWRAGSAVDPTVSCRRPCCQVAAPLRRRLSTTLGYGHGLLPAVSAWNGSWDDAPNDPSAVSAVSAMDCAISAASAYEACGRTSCKRLAIATPDFNAGTAASRAAVLISRTQNPAVSWAR